MPKTGDLIAAKYRIEQLIGVGGMGAVFSATHLYTRKRVALKWMLPELAKDGDAVQRFMREAEAAGRISHPNVVDVYDVGQHDESYFLVMEYLQGEPLTSALARRDLTPTEVLTLLLPAMRGVAAAHRQGVVHRDLKPDNIFLACEEDAVRREAKVLDFGISKLAADDQPSMHLTRTGAVVGTPYYMSPEQIRGSQQLDRRADVYAFGVILYEALTGQVPFHAETYGALVLEIATGTPRPLHELVPALPAALSRIVLCAMARDMNSRYPTMEELIAALEPFARPSTAAAAWHSGSRPGLTGASDAYGGQDPEDNFDATRLVPTPYDLPRQSAPASVVATKPLLASTPFASEATHGGRLTNPVLGIASLVVAAVAIVGAIWYFVSDPAVKPLALPHVVQSPATETQRGAASRLPSMGSGADHASGTMPGDGLPEARSVTTTGPTLSGQAIPELGSLPNTDVGAQGLEVTTAPGLTISEAPSTSDRTDSSPAAQRDRADHSTGQRRVPAHRELRRRSARRSHSRHARRPEPSPTTGGDVGPAANDTPQVIHRARSGTLNVNEF